MPRTIRLFLAAALSLWVAAPALAIAPPPPIEGVYLGFYEDNRGRVGSIDIGIFELRATNVATLWEISGLASLDGTRAFEVDGYYAVETGLVKLSGVQGKGKKRVTLAIEAHTFDGLGLEDGTFEVRRKKFLGPLIRNGWFESSRLKN